MIKSSVYRFLPAALLIFLSNTFVAAQTEKAEKQIDSLMKQQDVVGLSVAVVKGGEMVYTHAFGVKDIATNTALAEKDIFRIASISKSFSATSIMQLIEAGKLSLKDDVSDLVGFKVRNPRFPQRVITLKMILSHTSSLNDSQGYLSLDVINPLKNPEAAKCYNNYEPGKGYQYCNLNFNIAGTILEKISGERFDRYVKHHILDPLHLYGGYCVDSLDASRFVTIYEYDSLAKNFKAAPLAYAPRHEEIKNYVMGYSTPVFSPTGGMKISATDLAKYMMMHMNYGTYKGVRIMSKRSAKLMQRQISKEEGYGLAIMHLNNLIPAKRMTGHTGSAYGLYSAMFFQPKEKFGIVVITNGCSPVYDGTVNRVIKTVMNSLYANFIR